MHAERKKRLLAAFVFALVLAGLAFWTHLNRPLDDPPGPGYYHGAMRNKANPNLWVTEDGKIVPPPPGAKLVPADAKPARGGRG
jgi:hypothetical protein